MNSLFNILKQQLIGRKIRIFAKQSYVSSRRKQIALGKSYEWTFHLEKPSSIFREHIEQRELVIENINWEFKDSHNSLTITLEGGIVPHGNLNLNSCINLV